MVSGPLHETCFDTPALGYKWNITTFWGIPSQQFLPLPPGCKENSFSHSTTKMSQLGGFLHCKFMCWHVSTCTPVCFSSPFQIRQAGSVAAKFPADPHFLRLEGGGGNVMALFQLRQQLGEKREKGDTCAGFYYGPSCQTLRSEGRRQAKPASISPRLTANVFARFTAAELAKATGPGVNQRQLSDPLEA